MTSRVGGVRGRSPVAGRALTRFAALYLLAILLYLALVVMGYSWIVRQVWP
jgi:hypothetical protein